MNMHSYVYCLLSKVGSKVEHFYVYEWLKKSTFKFCQTIRKVDLVSIQLQWTKNYYLQIYDSVFIHLLYYVLCLSEFLCSLKLWDKQG